MKKSFIILVLVVILILFQSGKSLADTRVVVSVSIGTGVVVGAVGLFIHLGYSARADLLKEDSHGGLVFFPDTGPLSLIDSDHAAIHEGIRDKSIRAYIVGIRW